jgi:S-adenosylmethionine:tRNA ribosyltransferase-isomerase
MINPKDFFFELPDELIARYPAPNREDSRLLVLNRTTKTIENFPSFRSIQDLLRPSDILVYNSTRVSKRRVFLRTTLGRVHECLFLEEEFFGRFRCLVRNSGKLKIGDYLYTEDTRHVWQFDREGDVSFLQTEDFAGEAFFEEYGTIPIPPYLKRKAEEIDEDRYQTIFANQRGSVAAPTAGLHFSEELKADLQNQGVQFLDLCLNVGYGTFAPLEENQIQNKRLHKETFTIPQHTVLKLNQAKGNSRIIAIGTTTLRALEACLDSQGRFQAGDFSTEIFIWPGDVIRSIDGLITNFHLPESSLLMLVSAFAEKELVLQAYQAAVKERMRFFSYGDAMLIL